MKYAFKQALACNMCGSPAASHRILGRRLNTSQGLRPWTRVGIATTIVQCRSCDLIFPNPLPVPYSLQDHYGVPPESYWESQYFDLEAQETYFRPQISMFERLSPAPSGLPPRKALDVGAGIGKGMRALSLAGFDAYGLEPSESFHRMAVERTGIPADRLQLSRVEDAIFEESCFDFITFSTVLEHFYDPDLALRNAIKWIKPDGLIQIAVPSADWLVHRLARAYYRMRGSDYVANLSPMHPPYHLYEFSLKSFIANGARNGYEVVHHHMNICQTYMPKVLDPLLRAIMKATSTGMEINVWLRKGEKTP